MIMFLWKSGKWNKSPSQNIQKPTEKSNAFFFTGYGEMGGEGS